MTLRASGWLERMDAQAFFQDPDCHDLAGESVYHAFPMSIWNRLSRSVADFSRSLAGWFSRPGEAGAGTHAPERSVAFTMAVIALSAKLAKADGVVSDDERAAFSRLFSVPPGQRAQVERLFRLAGRSTAGFEAYARQIARLFHDSPQILEDVLDSLFHIAGADGVMHPGEMSFLERVTEIFGLKGRFRCIRARHMMHPDDAAYEVLGVNPCDDWADIRAAYRRLVRENHPDRLMARGVPQEMVEIANRRMAAINAAFEAIGKERGEGGRLLEIGS